MSEQALHALDRATAALTCDEIECFPAHPGGVPLLRASIGVELVQIEKSLSGRGKTLLSATAAAIDEALLAIAEARQALTATPGATEPAAPRKRGNGSLRGAPLFLRPSVVRGLIDGVTAAAKGTTEVPVAPIRLVNMPRRSEDPRLAKANDDSAMPLSPAAASETHEPGRVVPPVKPSAPALRPATANKAEPEGWPDAPLPEFEQPAPVVPDQADPDLDRPAPEAVPLEVQSVDIARQPRRRDGIIRTHARRAERALEAPVDRVIDVPEAPRLDLIRAAAQRLAAKTSTAVARPSIGARRVAEPAPLPVLLPELRRQRIEAAIKYLGARGVLVSVHDRFAQVRKYHVSGRRETQLAEDVIALAVTHGLELPA